MSRVIPPAIERLSQALERGEIAEGDIASARECVERFGHPLRISVMGTDPVLATDVVNFLAADDLLPNDVGLGIPARLMHATREGIIAKGAEGEPEKFPLDAVAKVLAGAPKHIKIGADLDALNKITLTRFASTRLPVMERALDRHEGTSDVTLWCSATFDDDERALWSAIPKSIRDHAFHIAPSGAPKSADSSGLLCETVRVDISAAEAIRQADGFFDRAGFERTGGTALVRLIRKEVDLAKQSILDTASVILARNDVEVGVDRRKAPRRRASDRQVTQARRKEPAATSDTPKREARQAPRRSAPETRTPRREKGTVVGPWSFETETHAGPEA